MNIQYLIDSIVRQTTVLIAQVATSGGARAPLANIANQVFLELTKELEAQGVGRKVGADMFGIALRSYQRKIQRVSESSTFRGQSLWEAVFDFLGDKKVATRGEIAARFRNDDETLLRGVLHDLTESGLLFRSGSGIGAAYRRATEEELGMIREQGSEDGTEALVWAHIYRAAPIGRDELLATGSLRPPELDAALAKLEAEGRIQRREHLDRTEFLCRKFEVGFGDAAGWEAAVFDHFQAMVKTITNKLAGDSLGAQRADITGGSTYTFDVWEGHPLRDEVHGLLAEIRERMGEVRGRVDVYNAQKGLPPEFEAVVGYVGQCVIPGQGEDVKDDGDGD